MSAKPTSLLVASLSHGLKPPPNVFQISSESPFLIPIINTRLPLKLHPHYYDIKLKTDQWLIKSITTSQLYSSYSGQEAEDKHDQYISPKTLTQWLIPYLMCLATPEAIPHKLLLATKALAWMFVADDVLDDIMPHIRETRISPSSTLGINDTLIMSILRNPTQPQSIGVIHESRPLSSFCTLCSHLLSDMPVLQRRRFSDSMVEFFQAVRTLNKLRRTNTPLPIQEYIELRRISAGVYPSFLLSEYALGIEKDEEMLESTLIKELELAAVDHIAWVNDVYSLRKEYLKGEWHNLPSLLCITERYKPEEAMAKVYSMVEETERKFTRLKAVVEASSKLREKQGLLKYIDTVGFWMSGNLHWSAITGRFNNV